MYFIHLFFMKCLFALRRRNELSPLLPTKNNQQQQKRTQFFLYRQNLYFIHRRILPTREKEKKKHISQIVLECFLCTSSFLLPPFKLVYVSFENHFSLLAYFQNKQTNNEETNTQKKKRSQTHISMNTDFVCKIVVYIVCRLKMSAHLVTISYSILLFLFWCVFEWMSWSDIFWHNLNRRR